AAEPSHLAQHWLLDGDPTASQVAECLVIDRLLRVLPRSHLQVVGMRNPSPTAELVEAIELAERASPFPRRVGISRPIGRQAAPGPRDEPMPTEVPATPARTWLASCIVHRDLPAGVPEAEVKINRRLFQALLDFCTYQLTGICPFLFYSGETSLVLTACWPPLHSLPAQKGAAAAGEQGEDPADALDGESPSKNSNLLYDVFQQVTGGGTFAKEQHEDDRLKDCWTQAFRCPERPALLKNVYWWSHSHPLAGHLGATNTIQRIRDHFYWPGLEAVVKRFCQACPTMPPPSPLIPLPIIVRIGMDLVGPLPKSAWGHEHILVIKAVPIRKATAKAIAHELFMLCSRGTPFMSRLMADLCHLLRVKQLRTTVYHPQTDGLRDWDLMLPYVLFGIREVPQASIGFTPQPHGLLDVAKEAWKWQPAPHRSVVEHVKNMRERIERVMPLVREHLTKAQQAQQRHYNRTAQPQEFQPGDHVMVLVPNSACKFLATWQGPYTVLEKYISQDQLYHVNILKKWVGTRDQLAALATTDPVVVDINPHLSPTQKVKLQHLIVPGQTHVLHHDIRTPPGVIVRQRPYRVPEAHRQAIEEKVQQMLKLGVTEPSRSPWSSPIVMVPKPDGTLRFCNDFRRLNEVSEFDGYPMPRVDELLDRLGRARFISTLDLTKGYWQVPLSNDAKPTNATNPRKCHLALSEAEYLGFQVGCGLIKLQEKKIEAVRSAPRPATKTRVRAFMGLVGYYCCFIPNFSSLAAPLTDLTRKGQPEQVSWTPEAFLKVQQALTSEPVPLPAANGCFRHRIGRRPNPRRARSIQNYVAIEKEALAVKWAVLELRYYLLGSKLTLVTDHASLQWMAQAKDTNARVTRGFLMLQDFHFDVRHRARTANANGLSRI
ncbi:hypothetical protein M9458_010856, partial [Cirrhinus mrigala]